MRKRCGAVCLGLFVLESAWGGTVVAQAVNVTPESVRNHMPVVTLPPHAEAKYEARSRLLTGDPEEAIRLAEIALDGYQHHLQESTSVQMQVSDRIDIAQCYNIIGEARMKQGRLEEAYNAFGAELQEWRQINSPENIATTLQALARIEDASGKTEAALGYLEDALALETTRNVSPNRWNTEEAIAKLLARLGRLDEAEAHFRAAVAQVEHLRAGLVTFESKAGFLAERLAPYYDLVAFLIERRGDRASVLGALEVSELARARALLDLTADPSAIHTELTYAPLERVSPTQVAPRDAATLLAEVRRTGVPHIVYFVTPGRLYAWAITSAGAVKVHALPINRAELKKLVAAFHTDVEQGFLAVNSGRALAERVLWPVLDDLGEREPGSPLAIVPHGPLNGVPLAGLPLRGGKPLGVDSALSVVPSLSFLPLLSPYSRELADRLLAVGAPANVTDPAPPKAAQEIADAAELFPNAATILTGAAATSDAIESAIPGHTHLLFSTHGVAFEDGLPWVNRVREPYLILSANQQLTSRKIQTLNMRSVRFVALSACETEVGQIFDGDEVFSLARAFLVAGARNVLVSLLKVPDVSTAQIVVGTIRELRSGKSPAAALRLALQAYLDNAGSEQARAPLYWAPWLIIGSPS